MRCAQLLGRHNAQVVVCGANHNVCITDDQNILVHVPLLAHAAVVM